MESGACGVFQKLIYLEGREGGSYSVMCVFFVYKHFSLCLFIVYR
jgi:hypothetical protein